MKDIYRILGYVRSYLGSAIFNVIFNLLSIVFELFSLAMVAPLLGILFKIRPLVMVLPEFQLKGDVIMDYGYYYLTKIIAPEGVLTAEGQAEGLIFICILVSVSFFFKNAFRYFAMFFMAPIRYGVVRDIRMNVYDRILALSLGYFTEARKGDLMARMTTDILEIEVSIMTSLEIVFKDPLKIIAFLAFLFMISPELTLFVIVLLPVTGLIIGRIGKSLRRTSAKGQRNVGFLISIIEETLTGIRIIKAFTAEKLANKKFTSINNETMRIFIRMLRKRDLSSPLSEFLGVMVMVSILWYGGKLVLDADLGLGAELFIAYILIFSQIIAPAKSFASAYYNIQKGAASLDRVNEILSAEVTIKDSPNAISLDKFEKEIAFEDLSFSYGDRPTLKKISLKIPKGKTLALVGQSGSGKTTIANLLPRFYDHESGSILLDGRSIKDYKIHDLRQMMGVVTQESILFNDSVYNNIAFGLPNASKEEVVEAANIANAHGFIEEMSEGYDTNVGDMGGKLSGGQRQRLSIARAVLKNPPILILDEATSALDTESERMVQEAIYNLMKNRTSLVIAHRLSTIKHADEIAVVHEGEITERGTHDELMAAGGTYKRLHDMQAFE
ncbi:MAG: ABC transporter ATP-binding protein [Flavobacteriales bacterium]|nr:ABC transporter ATP-binding protein [Flavobacteriales bacterium]